MKFLCFNIVTFFLLIVTFGCEKNREEYIKKNYSSLLAVSIQSDTLEADGVSSLAVKAFIHKDATKDRRNVVFQTTEGKFEFSDTSTYTIEATVDDQQNLSAGAFLISSVEEKEKVKLKISIADIDTTLNIVFKRALPDKINVESSVASVPKGFGSEVPLQIFLKREKGTPSKRQIVNLRALKQDNNAIGEFRAASIDGSNGQGKLEAIFTLKDTVYTGPIKIIGSCIGNTGNLSDTLTVFIIE